jgi:hypothetical protein
LRGANNPPASATDIPADSSSLWLPKGADAGVDSLRNKSYRGERRRRRRSARRRRFSTYNTNTSPTPTALTPTALTPTPTPTPTPSTSTGSGSGAGGAAGGGAIVAALLGYIKERQMKAEEINTGAAMILTGRAVKYVLASINKAKKVNVFPTLTACDLAFQCQGKAEIQREFPEEISTEADINTQKALCALNSAVESWRGEKEKGCCTTAAADCGAMLTCKSSAENAAETVIISELKNASEAIIRSYEEAGVDIDKKMLLLALYSDITRGKPDSTLRAKMVKAFGGEEIDAEELKTFEAKGW